MNETYRSVSRLHFLSGGARLLGTLLAGLGLMCPFLVLIIIGVLLDEAAVTVNEWLIAVISGVIVIVTLAAVLFTAFGLKCSFTATVSEVTFRVSFLKRTFRYSEIDDIQVETRYIVSQRGKVRSIHRTGRYLAEKITIVCGGRKSSFCARIDYDVDHHLRERRGELLEESCSPNQTAPTYRQRLAVEKQIRNEDLAAERIEHSRFYKLKEFIEEYQKNL